jgi:hypothetical protein
VVEQIFGVLKRRFHILIHPPEYDLDIQARIPPALAAVHNFIRRHDPDEIEEFADSEDLEPGEYLGELALGPPRAAERERANTRRDRIAQDMWVQYQTTLQERNRA